MKKEEIDDLVCGVYAVHWKTGGVSVAALGMLANGDMWIAPTNWIEPAMDQNQWRKIERMELICLQSDYDENTVIV